MIKMLTAATSEADDIEYAISDLLQQLNLEQSLLKNSVGLIMTHPDFYETGVAQEIGKRLPFDVIGGATSASMIGGSLELVMLSIAVLTSDDIEFSTHSTGTLTGDWKNQVKAHYDALSSGLSGTPSMIMPLFPLGIEVTNLDLFDELLSHCGDIPMFGTVAFKTLTESIIQHNDNTDCHQIASIMMCGDVNPSFFVESLPEEKVQKEKAVITKSNNAILMEVDEKPVLEYLRSRGISTSSDMVGAAAIPFFINTGEGAKEVARGFLDISPEGYAICGGRMTEGATLAIGSMEREDVIITAEKISKDIASCGKTGGALLFSCGSRSLVTGSSLVAETAFFEENVIPVMPCQCAVSAGEIAPVISETGKVINFSHSYTIVACVFQ